jgi:hypothetical protein
MSNRTGPRSAGHSGPVYDPDVPVAGHYRWRMAPGAPFSAIKIWLGHSIDPETLEEMSERPLLWQCTLNGQRTELQRFWPACARDPLSLEEHDRIVARNATPDEASPFYDPRAPINLATAPPPF